MKSVRVELLQELAGQLPEIIARDSDYQASTAFDLDRWIADRGLEVIGPTGWNGGQRWIFETCPWNPDHRNRSAFILRFPNGAVAAGCLHSSCRDKDWHSLRDVVEPGWKATLQSAIAASENAWQQPLPFHRFDLPPFPSQVLPTWLRAFVEAEATATQTPVDLAGMLSLSVLAAACAKKVVVSVREGYCEPVNIFTVTALPSGSRKTAVFAAAVKPLEDYEQSEVIRTADEIARKQAAQKIREATLRKVQDQAVHAEGKKREKFTEEASALAAELANTPAAVGARYIVDDCTPEKLPGLLRDQGGRIAVMSPEGDVFDLMAGRYSTNRTGNFGVFLKGHAGDTLRVDRVGRAPEFVKAPALTLGLAVQPDVIRGLAEKPGFRGRGLLGRLLFSVPASLLGRRRTDPGPVPTEVRASYHRNVLALLDMPFGNDDHGCHDAHILTLDPDAQDAFRNFETWLEPQLAEFGELGGLTDWGGKLAGAVARIAGLLHMADHAGQDAPWSIAISQRTVEHAIAIGKYLIPHAKAAFAAMGADATAEKAKKILRWIEHDGLDSFTRRDAHQSMRSTFRRPEELEAPLAVLVDRGFIRRRLAPVREAAGRPPSPAFDVNPLWARRREKSTNTGDSGNSEYFEHCETAIEPEGDHSPEATEQAGLE